MFGGDPNPNPNPTDPRPNPNLMAGRFFANTVWRSGDSKPSSPGDRSSNDPSESEPSTARQRFGTFSKALEQLKKDSRPAKKQNATLTNNEILTLQSLYVSDIPDNLLEKAILLRHFSQFGKINRISISVKRKGCTIHFENHEVAEKAKTHGAILDEIELNIFWSRPASSRRSERKHSESSNPEIQEESIQIENINEETKIDTEKPEKVHRRDPRPSSLPKFDLPDEVQDELQAMAMVTYNASVDRPVSLKKSVKKSPKKIFGSKHAVKKRLNLSETLHSSGSSRSKHATAAATDVEVAYGSTSSTEELQKIMRTPSRSSEDRYRVLEARDKLMRMKRVRQSDIMKARENRGTCPDMCPEKERYHREYQRQIASYEQLLPGKMDTYKGVKEYSRSSADQEEPLSHELRPGPVLRMTMDHLMWNLMDLCNKPDENLADWYYYIWDRTRSIRKDITQQDLCDENAVTLVEQCSRFHIFCSERLIGEELSVYDDQINTENLTKCLQTLKYMYHDLSLKGVSCPNEAEFRAYFVLLNLNEGDCMWEVQQLSGEVRQAEPVRFALQVGAALCSNNFIRFFKLVRSSTYLNACILHRYFTQVRSRALSTILKAYCSRVDTVFTLDEVVRLTGFENAQEAALLCAHHGLRLSPDGRGVVFSRSCYCQPDTVLTTARNRSLIEGKYSGSVADVVSGGIPPQSNYRTHVPHDSFDTDGLLKAEAWKGIDQQSKAQVRETDSDPVSVTTEEELMVHGQPIDIEAQMRRDLLDRAFLKQVEQTTNDLVREVVEDEVCSIVEKCVKDAHVDEATNGLCDEVFREVLSDMIQGVCTEVITAELCLARERMRAKQLALEADMRNKLIENKAFLELNLAVDSVIREICEGVMDEEVARDEAATRWTEEVLREVVEEECRGALDEAVSEARAVKLDAILLRVQSRTMSYFFYKWRSFVNRSKRTHESMLDFPAWMSNMSLDEQVSGMELPDPCYLQRLTERHRPDGKPQPEDRCPQSPPTVDVGSAVASDLVRRMKEVSCYNVNLFWKAVVSLPDAVEAPDVSDSCRRWTGSVFSLDDVGSSLRQTTTDTRETLTVSVRCVTGPTADVDACNGVNGVFFWLSHKETSTRAVCQRLLAVLSAKPQRPSVPVALVWSGPACVDHQTLVDQLALDKLQESKYLSQYKFFARVGNTRRGLANQMERACQWLAQCTPRYPPLLVTSMRQLANQCLTDELWEHIHENNANQSPNTLVDVYNSALLKLQDLLNDNSLKQYSLGAAEFQPFLNDDYVYKEQSQYQIAPEYWGSKHYYSVIDQFLSTARLAPVVPWPPRSSQELKKTLGDYCESQSLPHVVGEVYLVLERHRTADLPPSDWGDFLETLPWSRVLQTVAEAKLIDLHDLLVVVHRNGLQWFRCSPWWIATDIPTVTLKRPLVNEVDTPKKHQRLSLSDTLTKIKEVVSKIDSTMKSAKLTREEIEAKYDSP